MPKLKHPDLSAVTKNESTPGGISTEREVQRLAEVYASYRSSRSIRAKWDGYNAGNRAILAERSTVIRRMLGEHRLLPLSGSRVLDVGCGSGAELASLIDLGAQPADLFGIDLLPDRVAEARLRYPEFDLQCANAENLPFPDSYFDLVLLFTVFSSILNPTMERNVAREVRRVLRDPDPTLGSAGGAILWYDIRYDNPGNRNVRGIGKDKLESLFPSFQMDLRNITVLPFLARRLGLFTRIAYPPFALIPILRTHFVGILVKSEARK